MGILRALRYTGVITLCLLLCACGFQLRGASTGYQPTFTRLYIEANDSPLIPALRAALQLQGVSLTRKADAAQASVIIHKENHERLILSRNPQGQINEYQLRYTLTFSVVPLKQDPLIAERNLNLSRDYNYANAQTLSQESEEQALLEEMHQDAAEQIVRQIEALSLQPLQSIAP